MSNVKKAAKPRVDWDAIEPHYRAGIRALKDIGSEFGVSDAGIIKHAREAGWTRNLKAKIQAKADAKVSAAMVSAEVSEAKALTEATRIEVESEVQARIRLAHRADIGRARSMVMTLLGELEQQTGRADLFEELADLVLEGDDGGADPAAAKERQRKRMEAFQKAMSLGSRTVTVQKLTEALKSLVGLEREAFGITGEDDDKPLRKIPQEDLAREVGRLLAKAGLSDGAVGSLIH